MGPATYDGPGALGMSKYASLHSQKAALAVMPSDGSSHDNTIATREQIAAAGDGNANGAASGNADAQLAVAQGHALKAEVDKHAAKLSRTISTAVTNTRQLLALIHESLSKEGVTGTENVDSIWAELEHLIAAAGEAKAVIPVFLEKQRNNMSLYHASMMNETMRDTQEELNIQHKKVNLQHTLILEHQEAFHEYKEQNATKLKELEDLQERVSRLTLEKGNFRNELDNYKSLLNKEQTTNASDLKKLEALEKELRTVAASKKLLLAEADSLRDILRDNQEKMQLLEQNISDKFKAELKLKADEVTREAQKNMELKSLVDLRKADGKAAQMQAEKLSQENATLKEKYDQQAAEHAQAFMKLDEQTKKIDTLVSDLKRQQEENLDLKQRVTKLSELEKQNADLSRAKSTLTEKTNKLSAELEMATEEGMYAKTDIAGLKKSITELEKTIRNLETQNNDLYTEQAYANKAAQALNILKSENLKLSTTIEELRSSGVAPAVGSSYKSDQEKVLLMEKINELEANSAVLQTALEEWTNLAKRSYKEYKDMLPLYKQAEQYHEDLLTKDDTIKDLKNQLSAAKASLSDGVSAGGDSDYWKGKYEALLATVGG
ncbi:hypothetical protein J1614_008587 [Plenodomus biglobosus]|nr:hypothetical protein J1614_008587 [Plenodomus biglobosus]